MTVQTCEVVQHPGTLSGQSRLTLQVGLKKCTQSDHNMDITHFSAQGFHWAGEQEVSHAPQQRTDELESKSKISMLTLLKAETVSSTTCDNMAGECIFVLIFSVSDSKIFEVEATLNVQTKTSVYYAVKAYFWQNK